MAEAWHPRVLSERQGKWLVSLFPPLLFNRIRVVEFGAGYRTCRVRIARSLLTRNLNGTIFGGTIFSAADPIYAVLYWQIFSRRGERIQVWLKSARVAYLRPAASALELRFELTDADVERAVAALDRDGRYTREHETAAVDRAGRTCARIATEVYLRRPRTGEREVSAF